MSKRKKIVFLILIAFSNLIAFQNQFVICKESSGKIFIESSLNKCCDKNESFCCKSNRNFKLEYSKQCDTCTDTQLEIAAFSNQNSIKVIVEQSSSSLSIDSYIFVQNNFVTEYPKTANNLFTQSQKLVDSTVLLI